LNHAALWAIYTIDRFDVSSVRYLMRKLCHRCFACACLWLALLAAAAVAPAADTLVWDKAKDRVTADIRGWQLPEALARIAADTGWQVYVESNTTHAVSAKFKDLPAGEALRFMLGDLNFALVPETNASPRLFVFRTSMQKATQLVSPAPVRTVSDAHTNRVPDELIVRLKPGARIDDLARLLGARVIGRIDGLNAYRLQFNDAAAVDAARGQLDANPDVAGTDYNYYVDRPPPVEALMSSSLPPLQLQLNPPSGSGRVVVGLVDTAVQPLGDQLDKFLLKAISVAGDPVTSDNSPTHGTAMAETILRSLQAATKGSTSVQILPVDVYGPNANTTTYDVALGVVQAVNNGATVLNLSLGGAGDSTTLSDLLKSVSDRGIPIFAAAGNQPVTTPFYPAADPGVIAVTAVDQGQIASYANRGSFVDLAAPGSSVVYLGGQPYLVQGTSASAAYVSGAAAGLLDSTHRSWLQIQPVLARTFAVPSSKNP
jgi:hypothetical protein